MEYYVRAVFSRSTLTYVKTHAKAGPPWEPKLVNKVKRILSTEVGSVSVYLSESDQPTALGHAMGIIAATIGAESFSDQKELAKGRNAASCLLERQDTDTTCDTEKTPENCHSFWPAREFHYDLHHGPGRKLTTQKLAEFFLDRLHKEKIDSFEVLKKGVYPYAHQVWIVHEHCRACFGSLAPENPPSEWLDSPSLNRAEQIRRLISLPREAPPQKSTTQAPPQEDGDAILEQPAETQ